MQQLASWFVIFPRSGTRLSSNLLANNPVDRREKLVFASVIYF
jgi:hypothetical protein